MEVIDCKNRDVHFHEERSDSRQDKNYVELEFTTDDITDDYFESEATSQETAIQPVLRCSETKLQIIIWRKRECCVDKRFFS